MEPARCEQPPGVDPERLELGLNSSAIVASGLQVHFVGSTQDHYEDGSFDVLAELRFAWGDERAVEIVSALAPADPPVFRPVLDHCWRLAELTDEGAIVELLMPGGPALPSCAELEPPSLPVFDDFADVSTGARFTATLRYDTGAHQWSITPQPRMLHHHATRVEWSNLAELGRRGLGQAVGADVQVTLRFESSEITASPERHMWLSEHVASIESACVLANK